MKALLLAALSFLPLHFSDVGKASNGSRPLFYTVTKSTTGSAPTGVAAAASAGTYLNMNQLCGYRLTLCAASGQTLSGAGTIQVYYQTAGASSPSWSRNPQLDETVSLTATSCLLPDAGSTSCQCQTFGDHPTYGANQGFADFEPNGVTESGGTTVTIIADGLACP